MLIKRAKKQSVLVENKVGVFYCVVVFEGALVLCFVSQNGQRSFFLSSALFLFIVVSISCRVYFLSFELMRLVFLFLFLSQKIKQLGMNSPIPWLLCTFGIASKVVLIVCFVSFRLFYKRILFN